METDKEMTKTLEKDFSVLNESNKKNIIEMTKFLVRTQDTIVPRFLKEKSPVDMSIGTEKGNRSRPYCIKSGNVVKIRRGRGKFTRISQKAVLFDSGYFFFCGSCVGE
jgi:hypothetical protein